MLPRRNGNCTAGWMDRLDLPSLAIDPRNPPRIVVIQKHQQPILRTLYLQINRAIRILGDFGRSLSRFRPFACIEN